MMALDGDAQNRQAIATTLAATAAFTISDTLMKLSASGLPAGQTIALRGVFATIAMTMVTRAMGALCLDRRLLTWPVVLRTTCEIAAAITYFIALYRMPIATATAILQFLPLALTAASAIVLREAVGWRRWLATAIGFVGVLMIVRPGASDYGWPSLWMLACVGCITLRDLVTRRIAPDIPSLSIAWLTAAAVMGGGALLDPPWVWETPSSSAWAWLAGAALATVLGNLLMIVSTRTAGLAVIAPFRYATIVFAILAGYLVWSEVPDGLTLAGIAIVVAAGLYTFHRERLRQATNALQKAAEA